MLWMWIGLTACEEPEEYAVVSEPAEPVEEEPEVVVPPCEAGDWGAISDPEASIHVQIGGDDASGDGSGLAPFASVAAAVAALPNGGAIALGPGSYVAGVELAADFTIEGCSAAEVTLTAEGSVIRTTGLLGLSALTIAGGTSALVAENGATLAATGVVIVDAKRVALRVEGEETSATLADVLILATSPDEGAFGWGLAVLGGSLEAVNLTIQDSAEIAFFADAATVTLDGFDIDNTLASPDGSLGRGIHLQNETTASIANGTILNSRDAGLFAVNPIDVNVNGVLIDVIMGALVPGTDELTSGDGVVFTQLGSAPASNYNASLTNSEVNCASRAGVLVSDVTVLLSGNTIMSEEPGAVDTVALGGSVVSGDEVERQDDGGSYYSAYAVAAEALGEGL